MIIDSTPNLSIAKGLGKKSRRREHLGTWVASEACTYLVLFDAIMYEHWWQVVAS